MREEIKAVGEGMILFETLGKTTSKRVTFVQRVLKNEKENSL